jgi:hypothetical protein
MSRSIERHLEFCTTDYQREVIQKHIDGFSQTEIGKQLGRHPKRVHGLIKRVHSKAALSGVAPDYNLNKETAPGFSTKRVSTAYGEDGSVKLQWHIQEPDKKRIEEMMIEFVDGFRDELVGIHKPIKEPKAVDKDLMSLYMIGDHHIGLYAWAEETGAEDWDVNKSEKILDDAVDRLVSVSPNSETGCLVNLGDFFHIQDTTSSTPNSKNLLDSDGRWGRTIRSGSHLIKRVVLRMLEKHKKVMVVNARGNHDPDASLFLNTAIQMYFENDKRVQVLDNFNKFVWFQFGKNLVVTHHGDKINAARLYESITRNLRKEWGEADHVYCYLGHIHHTNAKEIGGMHLEHFGILPPVDSWHNASGYGSDRTMTCIVLHKEYGEETRLKVNAERLK